MQQLLSDLFPGKLLNKSINPDEAVAVGAAAQGSVLSGDSENVLQDLLVIEAMTHSIGIETAGGAMAVMIRRGAPIPCMKTQTFTTSVDNQSSIVLQVFEGEASLVKDCEHLGKYTV